jgi:adenine-specific DNA-methyltransferase
MAKKSSKGPKRVEALKHDEAKRRNIPTAELQSAAERIEEMRPQPPVHYQRATPLEKGQTRPREADLDPQIIWNGARIRLTKEQIRTLEEKGQIEIGAAQLVWRGKDTQDWSDLVVQVPPLYIQEKIKPQVIVADLIRRSRAKAQETTSAPDMFADFNGLPDPEARLEFYQHDQYWSNRMILGDSLQVMASLAEREGLRGKVQCIYIDPPYGIKFNSNWQVSTLSRDVKDGKREDISREPEVVKAFRDTWKDDIHSYLTFLRDRLTVAKELLTDTGSIFVQIGEENVHLIRGLMDEVFGEKNFISQISFRKTSPLSSNYLARINDYILWFAKRQDEVKFRRLYEVKAFGGGSMYTRVQYTDGTRRAMTAQESQGAVALPDGVRAFAPDNTRSSGYTASCFYPFEVYGFSYPPQHYSWKTHREGMERLKKAHRLAPTETLPYYVRFYEDFPVREIESLWTDTRGEMDKFYVVQTSPKVVERCILMTTDPGDLVLDPTCGGATTAYVAEQWGRRWITIDTSRVALALSRARIMGARYPYYYLADSPEGRAKEQEVTGKMQPSAPTHGNIRQGFVYQRVPHIMLSSIANNTSIDTIWEEAQKILEPLRAQLNRALGKNWEEWEIPREVEPKWGNNINLLHKAWWDGRITRQQKIDESLSPHRVVPADEEELMDTVRANAGKRRRTKFATPPTDFAEMVLEHLKTSGVQQSKKADKLTFTSVAAWPGEYVNAEGQFMEGNTARRAAIFIGPEFGTVSRVDLVAAAREATEARFDVLTACAFNFDAHAGELSKLGPLPILKAKMNPDLHMAEDLKNTGKGNLFVVFGEPDIEIKHLDDGMIQVRVKGVDVFDPNTGEIRSDDPKDIAAWFIDTDYNEESFFVRHAYFLGAQDPYKSLKTALKAEIDAEAWEALYRETSRPFPRPATGRIAVKVINHFGDEVMKVFGV